MHPRFARDDGECERSGPARPYVDVAVTSGEVGVEGELGVAAVVPIGTIIAVVAGPQGL